MSDDRETCERCGCDKKGCCERISALEADVKTRDGMMDRMTENIIQLKSRISALEAELAKVDRYLEGRPIDLYGRYKYEVGFEAARAYFEPRLKTTEEERDEATWLLIDKLLDMLRETHEEYCSVKCPSVWDTAKHPDGQPHTERCKEINKMLHPLSQEDSDRIFKRIQEELKKVAPAPEAEKGSETLEDNGMTASDVIGGES